MPFYPLPKQLHPDFYRTGVKPNVPVEVDYNAVSKLGKLKNAIIAISPNEAVDIVTGKRHTSTSPSSTGKIDPNGIYINNDGNLGTFQHVIESGCIVAHARCTAPYSTGASRFLLNWSGSGEALQLQYNGFSSGRNWQATTRGGFGTTISTLASPKVLSNAELQQASVVVFGWDLDVGASVAVGDRKHYSGTGGATTNDTNERAITIGGSGWIGLFYSLFVFENDPTDAAKLSLSRDPYQLVKPITPMFGFITPAGGTIVDVAMSLGLSNNITDVANATFNTAIQLSSGVSCDDGGIAQAAGAVSLAKQLGYELAGIIAFDVDISFDNGFGDAFTGVSTATGAIAVGVELDQTISALANSVASVLFDNELGVSIVTAGQTISAAMSLGLSNSLANTIVAVLDGSVTLGSVLAADINAAAQADASLNLGAQVGMVVFAQAAAQAGLSLNQVVSVTTTAQSIIFGIITPDDRVFNVKIDLRSFSVKADDRIFKV